jgi:hypothetical protein
MPTAKASSKPSTNVKNTDSRDVRENYQYRKYNGSNSQNTTKFIAIAGIQI